MEDRANHETSEDYLRTLDSLDKWQLEDDDQDVRGCSLVTPAGERLGTIDQMLVDRDRERVAGVRLDNGRVLPVEPLVIRDDVVVYTGEMGRSERSQETRGTADAEQTIPIVEEELVVGKRMVDQGGVRVRSRVVEEPVTETVKLRNEEVEVERRPVNRRVDNPGALFQERDIEVTARGEEAVVGKETRVTEEVVVRKDVDERVERVSDTVRKTEVDVDDDRR